MNLFTIWLHHFHHLWEWQFLPIPCNCVSLLMTFSTLGKFWNPSSKRNNVPHNKTLISACQYCKCWHLTKSWPASTGFLILVACTQCSNPKDDYTCFLLNEILLGNLCNLSERLQWKDVFIHDTLLNVCLAYHHFLPLKWSKYSLNDLKTQNILSIQNLVLYFSFCKGGEWSWNIFEYRGILVPNLNW